MSTSPGSTTGSRRWVRPSSPAANRCSDRRAPIGNTPPRRVIERHGASCSEALAADPQTSCLTEFDPLASAVRAETVRIPEPFLRLRRHVLVSLLRRRELRFVSQGKSRPCKDQHRSHDMKILHANLIPETAPRLNLSSGVHLPCWVVEQAHPLTQTRHHCNAGS